MSELKQVIQSPNDKRQYKTIVLPNKVQALLISDPECDKSAAAVNVNVGQLEDPQDRQGIAHFLEHMLFMGTKTYPDESDYSAYLSKNGGMSNAYTDLMQTNYFFQCSNEAFEGALDRFSRFFSESLFDESCVERELNAVNSEHEKNLQSDMWRGFQLLRNSSLEGNAFKKFGTGNLETLKHDTIRDDLLKFYKNYYSANHMKVVVNSNASIEELEKSVNEKFSAIPNYDYERTQYKDLPFQKENLGEFYKVVPVQDTDSIEFVWVIENQEPLYKSSPASYLSHILGHEGKNSLFSKLKDEGYAVELSTYPWTLMSLFTLFQLEVKLTKKGLENYEKVVQIVFAYLKMLREKGPTKYIFDEIKTVNSLKFENLDKQKGMNYVLTLGKNMQLYNNEDIIRVNYLMEEYNEQKIKNTLDSFQIDNLRIIITSKSLEEQCDQTESIYGTKYKSQKFDKKIYELFQNPGTVNNIDLPPVNEFIPKNMDVLQADYEKLPQYPTKIHQDEESSVYYKQDNTFKVPKAILFGAIYTNDQGFGKITVSDILADLWVNLFNESIKELQYDAEMAYLQTQFENKQNKLELIVRGFNDSLVSYVPKFFEKLGDFNPENYEQLFKDKLENIQKKYNNFFLESPYQQAFSYQHSITKTGSHDPKEIQELLKTINFQDLVQFHKGWLKNMQFEWFVAGNIEQQKALELTQNVQNILKQKKQFQVLPVDLLIDSRTIQIPRNEIVFWQRDLSENETNSVVIEYFQGEKITQENKLTFDFINNILKEPIFSELRTKQQLGYIVFSLVTEVRGVIAFEIMVQSDVQCPQVLIQRIDTFLQEFQEKMDSLSDGEFETFRNSIRDNIKEKDQNIVKEGMRYWLEIEKHRYQFDRQQALLDKIGSITKQQVQQLFKSLLYTDRKRLEIHLVAPKHKEQNDLEIQKRLQENPEVKQAQSIEWIKKKLPLYPDFYANL